MLPARLSDLIGRAARTRKVPLFRTSYALILTTGVNAVLGLMFWIAAARLYPARTVGLGAGGISALQLVAAVGWVGLQFTLLRYVPVAGYRQRRLITLVYAAGGTAGLAAGVVFVLTLSSALKVPYIADRTPGALVFCASVVVWVVFALQDAALIGIRRSVLVPIENSLYGLLKLALLVALSSIHDPWTLLGVWVGAAGALTVGVNAVLFGRLLATDNGPTQLPGARSIAAFSAGHSTVALASWAPDFFIPLMVLRYLGDAANAYYYAAWTIGFSARLLVVNMANALTVEAAYAEDSLRGLTRSAARLGIVVLAPAVVVLLVGASLVLRVFGPAYVAAAGLLRYFALSLPPFAIATMVTTFDRVRERFGVALTITFVGSATAVGLDFVLIPAHGISGAGLAWLVGQCVAAAVALVSMGRVPSLRGEPDVSVLDEERPLI